MKRPRALRRGPANMLISAASVTGYFMDVPLAQWMALTLHELIQRI
jgi:hypothetical protein